VIDAQLEAMYIAREVVVFKNADREGVQALRYAYA
jgi:hypothetical protein